MDLPLRQSDGKRARKAQIFSWNGQICDKKNPAQGGKSQAFSVIWNASGIGSGATASFPERSQVMPDS